MKLFIIGYRCSGKTTIGRLLAKRLDLDFIDLDQFAQQKTKLSIVNIIDKYGWDKFRKLEAKILVSTKSLKNVVIATGGGVVLEKQNRQFVKNNGFCIWLSASLTSILHRLKSDPATKTSRPSLITNKELIKGTHELIEERKPLYAKTAHIKIDTSLSEPEELVKKLSSNTDLLQFCATNKS